MSTFYLESEYIPLIGLLKALQIASSGGEAQMLVEEGMVTLNGKPENRKRAKLRDGDIVKCNGIEIEVKAK
ncbi:MAG: RNA-binding S4 domain-containing protein [Bacteroidales bacterium]|nr:RNA-binding S4 domain-containing protein [Bacteroidales bacterium]MDD4383612.1 RNA-binding S4 domain-containing protein [Bacteroidales bacterium]MDY0198995.1 RNA-binding S4 domain-containing protein [Tenuifilaceae bacterium]